tara:strand:+ start:405 stop:653 length:249 start_codon:yes stop_codon:yes gene_type:complete
MKWVLVNKLDEIIDTCEISSGVDVSGAKSYFMNIKRLEEKEFDGLWRVMSHQKYTLQFKTSLQNRQIEWWRDDESYLDIDKL